MQEYLSKKINTNACNGYGIVINVTLLSTFRGLNIMKMSEIEAILKARRLFDTASIEKEVEYAFASDLMSDVLAFALAGALLITGLTNIQIIRTATMLDMTGIVFVRNKRPLEEAVTLAKKLDIPVLLCQMSMFETCGVLYQAGLKPCPIVHEESN